MLSILVSNIVLMVVLAGVSICVPLYFAERKTVPFYVRLYVAIGFFLFCFVLVAVPLDYSLTVRDSEHYFSEIQWFWRIFYFMSILFAWVVGPFTLQYSRSMAPTYWGRIKHSIVANAIFFGSWGALFILILVVLLYKGVIGIGSVYNLIVVTANTWGLVCVIALMGYGLVAMPRAVWRRGSVEGQLVEGYYDLVPANAAFEREENKLRTQIAKSESAVAGEQVDRSHPALKKLTAMLAKKPDLAPSPHLRETPMLRSIGRRVRSKLLPSATDDFLASILEPAVEGETRSHRVGLAGRIADSLESVLPSTKEAVDTSTAPKRLTTRYRKLRSGIASYARARQQRAVLLRRIQHLERVSGPPAVYSPPPLASRVPPAAMRVGERWIVPIAIRVAAVGIGILSVCVVVGELLIILPARAPWHYLTPWYWSLALTPDIDFIRQLAVLLPLTYMVWLTGWTMLRLRVWMFIVVTPHATNTDSLVRLSMYLPRYTPIVALNYLRMTMVSRSTAFGATLDPSNVPFFTTWFAMATPALVAVVGGVTLFRLWSRVPQWLGVTVHIFDDENPKDQARIEKGREIAEEAGLVVAREVTDTPETCGDMFSGLA